jgi:putative transposase
VTICVLKRACLFGTIVDNEVQLNDLGRAVETAWSDLPGDYDRVTLDQFVVMPNHVHGILVLDEGCRAALSEVVRGFKSFSAAKVNVARATRGASLWQRGYYEHVIRDDGDLGRIREYIANNPAQWALDEENPNRGMIQPS